MHDDPYTMDLRLCDDEGMVSHEPIDTTQDGCETTHKSYIERLNALRAMNRNPDTRVPYVGEPFQCTGNAHLAGEHFRCTSPAHSKPQTFTTGTMVVS